MSTSAASTLWRLRGSLIVLVLAVATLWLGAVGQLPLYIHPRYELFTVLLAALGLLGSAASIVLAAAGGRPDHAHDHGDGDGHGDEGEDVPPRDARGRALAAVVLTVSGIVAASAVLVPPATLSASMAAQRDIAATVSGDAGAETLAAAQAGSSELFASFTVRDWALLLNQTSDPAFYAGKSVNVTGFVTPHPDDPALYYVSRFSITCCAIDAVPYGVPVALGAGEVAPATDTWVRVTGEFVASESGLVLDVAEVTIVDEPAEPYLY